MPAARSLTVRALATTHQMSAVGGPSSEHVWKGLQSWPPDVTNRVGGPQVNKFEQVSWVGHQI